MERVKTAVLLSGRGSNLQSLIDATADKNFPAEIVCVISNVPGAGGLERAAQAGLPTVTINHRNFNGREPFEEVLQKELENAEVELVCLAGFMRLLTKRFVDRWHNRMINIHPSLLPSYKGLHTHERALKDGVRFTGCTVHFVRAEMDTGPIIVQAAVPVHPGDDADALADRVLTAEHRCYPLALKIVAGEKTHVIDNLVETECVRAPDTMLLNPRDN
ncbi:MAG: Phosphoribosylglycinamide formyltransferase [Alphaproteobacteria bacterium MarineAlpha11_Bin1]|nr:MAG: Phosphoribosylglycinamide formyltransferase [Alphaproteobacteria bacterium MarineAlpha11_Bin1]|tara:strand:+ start:20029 stop:20682 length:654 start_codon:yes stop_codon:yes gene_type:complete